MAVFTRSWWGAALRRAAYTGLAALVPLVALLITGDVTVGFAASVAVLAVLLSLATSLKGLPEVDGRDVPWWRAIGTRVLLTLGQVAAPALGAGTVLGDVAWHELGVTVLGAVAVTLLRTALTYLEPVGGLPEAGLDQARTRVER